MGNHSTLTSSKLKALDDETRRSDDRIAPYRLSFSHMDYPQESKHIQSGSWDEVKLCSMISAFLVSPGIIENGDSLIDEASSYLIL